MSHEALSIDLLGAFFIFPVQITPGKTENHPKVRAQCSWTIAFIAWESNSITNQKAILHKYAEDNGFANLMFYVDA